MPRWTTTSKLVLATIGALTLCAGTIVMLFPPGAHTAADDWRRTASGWERASTWQFAAPPPALLRPMNSAKRARYDSHPAVVALAQLTAALAALSAFSPRRRRGESRLSEHIAKSFRASAFGS